MTIQRLFAIVATLSILPACGGSKTEAADVAKPVETATPDPTEGETQLDPGPTAEEALTYVMGKIESGVLTEMEAAQWFTPGFLKQVPPEQLIATFAQLKDGLTPVKLIKKEQKGARGLSALLDTKAGGYRVEITVNGAVPRQIDGLLFKPDADLVPPKSFDQARAFLEEAGSDVMLSVSEIKKGVCTPVANLNATKSLAVSSTFKLWVLAALDRKISRNRKLIWDTKLAIEDSLKSLPSGTLQNEAAGTQLTLREYATKMMSISDNTATDHLINFVGRKDVEKMLKLSKSKNAKANTPFLMTREFFALKLAASDAEVAAYRKASVNGKRKLLGAIGKKDVKLEMAKGWTAPKHLDIEWFANGPDICNVMATIGKQAKWKTDSEVMKVLASNKSMPLDPELFTFGAFKGGNEPGVMNLSALVQRKDGRWFVATMTVNDKTKEVNQAAVFNVAKGVLALVGNAE